MAMQPSRSTVEMPKSSGSNPKIDDLKELAHWSAYHKLDGILQPTLHTLEKCGYDYGMDRFLDKRLDINKFMKTISQLDYSKCGGFEFLLMEFDKFISFYMSTRRMKEKGLGYDSFISIREQVLLQMCLQLLYKHLNCNFLRAVPDDSHHLSHSLDRFKINPFEQELSTLLKAKELKYPITKSEKAIYKARYKDKNFKKMMRILDPSHDKLDLNYIHQLFHQNNIDKFERDVVLFVREIENIVLDVPLMSIKFISTASSATALSPVISEGQHHHVDVNAVSEVIDDRNWTERRRDTHGPYANGTHSNIKDKNDSQQTMSTITVSQDSPKINSSTTPSGTNAVNPQSRSARKTNLAPATETRPPSERRHQRKEASEEKEENSGRVLRSRSTSTPSSSSTERLAYSSKNSREASIPVIDESTPRKRSRVKPQCYEPWKGVAQKMRNFERKNGSSPSSSKSTARCDNFKRCKWSVQETEALLKGREKHGNDWVAILNDSEFDVLIKSGRTNINIKDRARVLDKFDATLDNFKGCMFGL